MSAKITFCLTFTILVLGSIGTLIAYLASNASNPLISIEASISNYNFTSSGNLTTNFNLHITSLNPNSHYSTIFSDLELKVYNDGVLLADQVFTDTFVSLPKTPLNLNLVLAARGVDAGGAADLRMAGLRLAGGEARLEVKVEATMKFVLKGWKKIGDMIFEADCSPVTVLFKSEEEAVATGSRPCSVDVCDDWFC